MKTYETLCTMMELCPSLGLENGHDKATKKSPFGPYGTGRSQGISANDSHFYMAIVLLVSTWIFLRRPDAGFPRQKLDSWTV